MGSDEPTVAQLKSLIGEALALFYRRDAELIRRGVQEETISHRLALYLEAFLYEQLNLVLFDPAGYDVDTEYNKNGEDLKRLVRGDRRGKRPDIIVHRRGHNENNLLMIEVKKNRRKPISSSDDNKLRGATDPNHDFRYKLGLYLNLKVSCAELAWYCNGEQEQVICQNLEVPGYGR